MRKADLGYAARLQGFHERNEHATMLCKMPRCFSKNEPLGLGFREETLLLSEQPRLHPLALKMGVVVVFVNSRHQAALAP